MAAKADFTEEEWKALQTGAGGAGMLVAISDRGFFDTFREASALAKHVSAAHEQNESALVREIAGDVHASPFGVTASPEEIETRTVESLHEAVAALTAKAPDDLPAYRRFVLDVAQSVAEAAHGVAAGESAALETVRAAVGDAAAAPDA